MAALHGPSPSFLSVFLSVARASLSPAARTPLPLLSRLPSTALLPAALTPIPSLLHDLWDGLLRAVPKKKTSHMKKRHRQMAGKALKDVTALNKCSACGRTKMAHVLCPYCVQSIRRWIGNGFKSPAEIKRAEEARHAVYNEELRLRGKPPLEKLEKEGEKESI